MVAVAMVLLLRWVVEKQGCQSAQRNVVIKGCPAGNARRKQIGLPEEQSAVDSMAEAPNAIALSVVGEEHIRSSLHLLQVLLPLADLVQVAFQTRRAERHADALAAEHHVSKVALHLGLMHGGPGLR